MAGRRPAAEVKALPRPELPATFQATGGAKTLAVLSLVVFGGGGVLMMLLPVLTSTEEESSTILILFVLGLVMEALAAFMLHNGFRAVTLTEEGISARSPFGVKSLGWEAVERVRVGTSTRTERAGAHFGLVGALVASAAESMSDADPMAPFRQGRQAREGHIPFGAVLGPGGKGGINFGNALGFRFFDALIAEADARGIEVVSAKRGAAPRRRAQR